MRHLLLLGSGLTLAGCATAPCGDVGRAIADRTAACEGSVSLGVARARALEFTTTCPDSWWDPFSVSRGCVKAVENLECAEVARLGDDLEAWLAVHPGCDAMEYVGPRNAGSTVVTQTTTRPGLDLNEIPCSVDGGEISELTVTVGTDVPAMTLYWREPGCGLIRYADLGGGQSYVQSTFTGHVWVAQELGGAGRYLDAYEVDDAPTAAWTVTAP